MDYRRISTALAALLAIAFSVFAVANESPATGQVSAALSREIAAYIEAFKKQDTAAMSNLYAKDVIVVEHDEAARNGRSAIQAMWDENKKDQSLWVDCKIERENTRIVGETAYETGHSVFTFKTKNGELKYLKGQFMTVWRRQSDGNWKVQMEAWL